MGLFKKRKDSFVIKKRTEAGITKFDSSDLEEKLLKRLEANGTWIITGDFIVDKKEDGTLEVRCGKTSAFHTFL
jgi:hypothetical protein